MDPPKAPSFKLLSVSPVEARDETDEKYERCYGFLQNLINGVSEAEAHDALTATVCKSTVAHEEVCIGLLMSILTEPTNAGRYYRDLSYISRDGLNLVISYLNQIILEKYSKLHETCRSQFLWLLKEMIKNSIVGVESIVFNLLRQISGGDISPKNIWLVENMLDLLVENRSWLEKHSILIATVIYTYLRLIVDHGNSLLNALRQKEVDFCVSVLREKFPDCVIIGRDLVRLLQNVARIPEFDVLWKDICNSPGSLAPGFQGIHQLMTTRTSRRFLQCRLTPDMERKIVYLTSQVKFGQQKRYQEWFQRQYLSTPESQSLRCDLIRFICGVIHPSNEVLCSDIIPRWAIIGWILSSCTSNVAASNAKLSLFYDWLFYDPERDNIMNIEPAILVMYHSMRSHPVISVTLLDFLCRIMPNFYPSLATQVKAGINISLHQILEKRVLSSLSPLFEAPKLDRELRGLIRESFPEFCTNSNIEQPQIITLPGNDSLGARETQDLMTIVDSNHNNSEPEARFSDDDEESIYTKKGKSPKELLNNNDTKFKATNIVYSPPKIDLLSQIEQVGEELRKSLLNLYEEKDNANRCEVMEKFIQALLQDQDFDQEIASNVATALVYILHDELTNNVFPDSVDDESLEESIGSPIFVVFRNLCQTPEDDPIRVPILSVLAEMAIHRKCIGYLLLYFIKVNKSQDSKFNASAYKEYSKTVGKDLTTCLLSDLRNCQEEDPNMFCFLLPDIYSDFENITTSNAELLNLVVSCIDSTQLQDLICHVLQGNMRMVRKETIVSTINASLEWETFEQYCLWQLIAAHSINVENILPVLPKLEFQTHSEALTSILLFLKRVEPTQELLKHVINRDVKENDLFVVSVLKYWARVHETKLADLLQQQLTKSISPTKRKRHRANSQLNSTGEQILAHLDQLRQNSKKLGHFFNLESIQTALTSAQNVCSEAQKTRFSDLFALAEDYDPKPQMKRGKNAKGKGKAKAVEESNSETDASEEEVVQVKSKQTAAARKKRKAALGSDSD